MSKDIQDRPRFLMITDTAMCLKSDGFYAFGPVVREIDVFNKLFSTITWIGFNRPDLSENKVMQQVPKNVKCILLSKSGGNGVWNKLLVILYAPVMLFYIIDHVRKADVIHTRAPSSPSFLGAIISVFTHRKIWWHKYAGNWQQNNPPFFYGLQRYLLSKLSQNHVTINGSWPDVPHHCISFENPCLDDFDRREGLDVISNRFYTDGLRMCFVGSLFVEKGILVLLESLKIITNKNVLELHVVGTGPLLEDCKRIATESLIPVFFHGSMDWIHVSSIMKQSHLIVLPTMSSEGFPKVLAESSNFGCIPMVTDISSIGQYIINNRNGILLDVDELSPEYLANEIDKLGNGECLGTMLEAAYQMSELFTFSRYYSRINDEILVLK